MRVLVSGGCGFIGTNLVRYLIDELGHDVHVVDLVTYAGNSDSLSEYFGHSRFGFTEANICNEKVINEVFTEAQPEAVIHLAAESHVDRSIDGPGDFISTNIVGTFTMLQAARRYWGMMNARDQKRFQFVHVSTDEVFGSIECGLFDEDSRYDPRSPYSASKASADHLARAWFHTYGLPVVVTNCSNNYGPYQFPEKLIPRVILCALKGEPIPVYGAGLQERDWIHVLDHCKGLVAAMRGRAGETYLFGSGRSTTNIDVVRTICDVLDKARPISRSYSEQIQFVEDRPGHDQRYCVEPAKAERELGWEPKMLFESGIRETVLWYLKNELWWRPLLDAHGLGRDGLKGVRR